MGVKVDGLMLDPARVHTSEAQRIPVEGNVAWGGVWQPGVAKSFEELGVSKTEGLALVKEHNLKLVPAKADGGSAAGGTLADSPEYVSASPVEDEVGAQAPETAPVEEKAAE